MWGWEVVTTQEALVGRSAVREASSGPVRVTEWATMLLALRATAAAISSVTSGVTVASDRLTSVPDRVETAVSTAVWRAWVSSPTPSLPGTTSKVSPSSPRTRSALRALVRPSGTRDWA